MKGISKIFLLDSSVICSSLKTDWRWLRLISVTFNFLRSHNADGIIQISSQLIALNVFSVRLHSLLLCYSSCLQKLHADDKNLPTNQWKQPKLQTNNKFSFIKNITFTIFFHSLFEIIVDINSLYSLPIETTWILI